MVIGDGAEGVMTPGGLVVEMWAKVFGGGPSMSSGAKKGGVKDGRKGFMDGAHVRAEEAGEDEEGEEGRGGPANASADGGRGGEVKDSPEVERGSRGRSGVGGGDRRFGRRWPTGLWGGKR